MVGKKTSSKQEVSFDDMPVVELKKGVRPKKFGATKRMKSKKHISKALWECLVENDVDGFKEILRTHLELVNKEEIAKETGISRRTLFRMLSDEGNPNLENISKIIHKLCA